jgi:hypothetical protein
MLSPGNSTKILPKFRENMLKVYGFRIPPLLGSWAYPQGLKDQANVPIPARFHHEPAVGAV